MDGPAALRPGGRRPGTARDRPSPRPRDLGAARRRAHGGRPCSALPHGACAPARAPVPRPRPRRSGLAHGTDRGADRARPARPHPPLPGHAPAARRRHALRGPGDAARARPPRRQAGDRAERTRSASTSPRSACRWPETRRTARPATSGLARQFLHAARLAFDAPGDRRARGRLLAASGRPRRGARARAPLDDWFPITAPPVGAWARRIAAASPGTKATSLGTGRVHHAAWPMPSLRARRSGTNHLD